MTVRSGPYLFLALILLAVPAVAANRGVPVNPRDTVQSMIEPAGDIDTFVFDAFAGSKLSLLVKAGKGSELEPAISLLDPDGRVLDPGDRLRSKRSSARIAGLTLDETGRYAVRIGGGATTGAYELKLKGKLAKSSKLGDLLSPGETRTYLFGASDDTQATVTIKQKGGEGFEVTSVFDPNGDPVPAGVASFVTKGRKARAVLWPAAGFGDYGVRVRNGGVESEIAVKVRCRHAKVEKRTIPLSAVEPVVESVTPGTGDSGDTVSIEGRYFQVGETVVLFGAVASDLVIHQSSTEVTARVPPGSGTVAVTLVNPDGQESTLAAAFTYRVPVIYYSISGAVSGDASSGVAVELTGTSTASTVTGAGGLFSFEGLVSGSYTVTPSLADHEFEPESRTVVVSGQDVTGVDFACTEIPSGGDPTVNTDPPSSAVRLVFVHHSTGFDWLAAWHGGLGNELADNNYYVLDTDYGWDATQNPDIGDHTDIGHWYTWFADTTVQGNGIARNVNITESLYDTDSQSPIFLTIDDPGGENEIVMFKSCFPNSGVLSDNSEPVANLRGSSCESSAHTLSNCKQIYRDILAYFKTRTDKMFVVITAPPLVSQATNATQAANARSLNNWLVDDWLSEADWVDKNVYVFDYFTVLTDPGNHHRVSGGEIEHETGQGDNYAYYAAGGDSHPTAAGDQKATTEYVPLLNVFYHRWQEYLGNE